jgi:GNAT superfamily N-acetyltransferase
MLGMSIVAIGPHAQGRGLGARLLAPTLAEADAARAACYLETFSDRSRRFYEHLQFVTQGEFPEPTTGAQYALLTRAPRFSRGA